MSVPILQRNIAWLAVLAAVLMLATVLLSAYMRLTQAGLGCTPWPACYAQSARERPTLRADDPSGAMAMARGAHRVVAFGVLVLAVVMVMLGRSQAQAAGSAALRRVTGWILALVLALALLGVVTPGARLPAVAMGNLLGGFAVLALCWVLADRHPPAVRVPVLARAARIAALVLGLQIALGALVSSSFAALSCADWLGCVATARDAGWPWSALNPWHEPQVQGVAPIHPAGAMAQLAHRLFALPAVAASAVLAMLAWRHQRRAAAAALATLLLAQVALGLGVVAAGLPIALVLAHNAVAALLLAVTLRLA